MRKLSIYIISSILSTSIFAATQDIGFETVSLRMGIVVPSIPLEILPIAGIAAPSLSYEQNTGGKIGLGVDWGWLGTYLSFSELDPEFDSDTHGTSTYTDYQFHIFSGAIGLDLYFQDFKGYYLDNTQELDPTFFEENGNIIRDDLRSQFIGLNFSLTKNPDRLSNAAAINNTSYQSQSGGSWYYILSVNWQKISSDSTLAPTNLIDSYGKIGSIVWAEFVTVAGGAGYGQTWIIREPFFFHANLGLSAGPQTQQFISQSHGKESDISLSAKGVLRLALGSNGKRIFGGFTFIADNTSFQIEERYLNFLSFQGMLYLGIRI